MSTKLPSSLREVLTDPKGSRESSALRRYGLALALLAGAFCLRVLLTPLVHNDMPYRLFIPAAMAAAWYGRIGPALLVLGGGYALGDFFFQAPLYKFGPYNSEDLVMILTYASITLMGVIMVEAFHRTRDELRLSEAYGASMEKEIAERKRAERELQLAQRQLQSHARELEQRVAERTAHLNQSLHSLEGVLYHTAHDLRAPLRAMNGFAEMLLATQGARLDPDGQECARRIRAASEKADWLIADLLEYGQMGFRKPSRTVVDLAWLVPQVLEKLRADILNARAEIRLESPLPRVWADPGILDQVLTQLLENALKFVAPGKAPCVRLWVELEGQTVQVNVRDNGIGFNPQYQEKVFGIFERLPSLQNYPGTGIGLAIVKKGMELLDGDVGVETELGQGSRFWIELKLCAPEDQAAPAGQVEDKLAGVAQ